MTVANPLLMSWTPKTIILKEQKRKMIKIDETGFNITATKRSAWLKKEMKEKLSTS